MYLIDVEYELHTKIPRKQAYRKRDCKVIQECDRFVVVDLGNYRDTIEKYKLKNGEVKLLKKGEEDMSNGKEPKITKEQLIQECYNNGIDKESLKEIATKYGLAYLTLNTYFSKWKVREELQGMKNPGINKIKQEDKDIVGTDETRYTLTEKGEKVADQAKSPNKVYLKPEVFVGRLFKYTLLAEEAVRIDYDEPAIVLSLEDVDIVIQELKELKQHL